MRWYLSVQVKVVMLFLAVILLCFLVYIVNAIALPEFISKLLS